mmetsp:Transcript_12079/g.29272  ORF Transcript_12079/g.29272 Transcript_12079/m.29272 type:complete len:230 (+) Transcript_12079:1391-2080(+)
MESSWMLAFVSSMSPILSAPSNPIWFPLKSSTFSLHKSSASSMQLHRAATPAFVMPCWRQISFFRCTPEGCNTQSTIALKPTSAIPLPESSSVSSQLNTPCSRNVSSDSVIMPLPMASPLKVMCRVCDCAFSFCSTVEQKFPASVTPVEDEEVPTAPSEELAEQEEDEDTGTYVSTDTEMLFTSHLPCLACSISCEILRNSFCGIGSLTRSSTLYFLIGAEALSFDWNE